MSSQSKSAKITIFGDGFVLKTLMILLRPSKLNLSCREENLKAVEGALEGQVLKFAVKDNAINQICFKPTSFCTMTA